MGEWTDIVDIIAPSEAAYGDLVSIEARVKNLAGYAIYISTSGKFDDTIFYLYPEYATVGAGETYSFSGSFSMPNHDVRIYVWSYYWTGEEWYLDDEGYVDIALGVPPEEYRGTLSRMELEYDESRANIPAYDIPQGDRGLVHIWGRNDMTTNQKMGIWWQVKDPGGIIRETYAKWETLWTGPGKAQEFIGGRFNLDKTGNYTIEVQLFMNPDDQVVVDDYYGTLCTVQAVVPQAEFRGFGIAEYQPV